MLLDLFSTLAVVGSPAKPPGVLSSLLSWLGYTEHFSSGYRSSATFIENLEKPDKLKKLSTCVKTAGWVGSDVYIYILV